MKITQVHRAIHGDAHRCHARVVLMVGFVMFVVMVIGVVIVVSPDFHEFLRGFEGADAKDFRQVNFGIA
ncbi:hypothetical protein D3C75_1178670 [compost metagenome]